MTHASSSSLTGPDALWVFEDIRLVEELSQCPCENDDYHLKNEGWRHLNMFKRTDATTLFFPPLFYLEKTRTCCRRWTVGTCCWTRWGGRVKTTPLWVTSTSTMSSWGSCRSARTPRGYWRRWGWEINIHSKVYKLRELVHRAHASLLCRPSLNANFFTDVYDCESECAALQWSMI